MLLLGRQSLLVWPSFMQPFYVSKQQTDSSPMCIPLKTPCHLHLLLLQAPSDCRLRRALRSLPADELGTWQGGVHHHTGIVRVAGSSVRVPLSAVTLRTSVALLFERVGIVRRRCLGVGVPPGCRGLGVLLFGARPVSPVGVARVLRVWLRGGRVPCAGCGRCGRRRLGGSGSVPGLRVIALGDSCGCHAHRAASGPATFALVGTLRVAVAHVRAHRPHVRVRERAEAALVLCAPQTPNSRQRVSTQLDVNVLLRASLAV